jgi:uncharacterized protein YehS (DUF1456 family)
MAHPIRIITSFKSRGNAGFKKASFPQVTLILCLRGLESNRVGKRGQEKAGPLLSTKISELGVAMQKWSYGTMVAEENSP